MVVDDEPHFCTLFQKFFEKKGAHVVLCPTGDEAFNKLSGGEIVDGLLSDIRMPGNMDGRALVRKIQEEIPNPPKMFLMTAHENNIDFKKENLPIQMAFYKPFYVSHVGNLIFNELTKSF
jgi:CheY-like chemotaxis protein